MFDEDLHKAIEEYITANMSGGTKYSLTENNARDFTIAGAPLLSDGSEPFIIFKVAIQRGAPAAIGNTTKRRIGIVRAELNLQRESSDRDMYRMLDEVTPFLERTNFNGILFKDAVESGEFEQGLWKVKPWTFSFKTTQTLT